jgi:hypothetical protein
MFQSVLQGFGAIKADQLFGKIPCLTIKHGDGQETVRVTMKIMSFD